MFPFKKKQRQTPVPNKIALASDLPLQFRRAHSVGESLAEAIRRVCSESEAISACYLLDVRKPDTGETGLAIALTLDDEALQLDQIAQRFQTMLQGFRQQAGNIVIMSSASFLPACSGTEFYSRENF